MHSRVKTAGGKAVQVAEAHTESDHALTSGYTLSQVPYNVLNINGTFPLSRNVPHIGGLSNSAKRDKS